MNIQQIITRSPLCLLAFCTLAVAPTFAQTITHAPRNFDSDSAGDRFGGSVSGAGDGFATTDDPETVPGIPVSNRQEFLNAIAIIKTGSASSSTISLQSDINLTGKFQTVIKDLSNATIDGNGFHFTRTAFQIQYSMFDMINLNNVKFVNVGFNDTKDGTHGETGSTKAMVYIRNSKDVVMDNVFVGYAKGYAVYTNGIDGFQFINSQMIDAGILGLYVGHDKNITKRVVVDKNDFTDNSTNAVAFLGVGGSVQNRITNNRFINNHRAGRWDVAPKYGKGKTGGGQLYIAQADNVLIEGNVIKDGACPTCFHAINNPNKSTLDVAGIELSGLNGGDKPIVTRTIVRFNTIHNNSGAGIYQNQNSVLDGSTVIEKNFVYDNGRDYNLRDGEAKIIQ